LPRSLPSFPTRRSSDLVGLHSHDGGGVGAFNPGVLHDDYGIAHSGDEVHEKVTPVSFGQPYWIANFTFKSMFLQASQCRGHVFRSEEHTSELQSLAYLV